MMKPGTDHIPMRTCVGCGESASQDTLVRVVLSPESTVEMDLYRRVPGRGAYLHATQTCFNKAVPGGGFRRSFKQNQFVYEPERLWNIMTKTVGERLEADLHLARKAGAVVSGGNTVDAAIKSDQIKMLLIATDASDNTVDKFKGKGLPILRVLSVDALGRILNKPPRAVVGITLAAFADRITRTGYLFDLTADCLEFRSTR